MPLISPSLKKFPTTPSVRDDVGLIWGCAITPFEQLEDTELEIIGPDIPIHRCENCFGYINGLCQIRARVWTCSLCGNSNHVPNGHLRMDAPEFSSKCVEYMIPFDDENDNENKNLVFELPTEELPPLYIVLIDESNDVTTIEMITKAVESLVDSLPCEARFALFTFSDRLGIYDLNTNTRHEYSSNNDHHKNDANDENKKYKQMHSLLPHVLYLPLGRMEVPNQKEEESGAIPTFNDFSDQEDEVIAISDVLELDECSCLLNEQGVNTIKRSLRAISDEAGRYHNDHRQCFAQCFGLALGRIYELLLSNHDLQQQGQGGGGVGGVGNERLKLAGMKMLCFLTSPCTHGPGCVYLNDSSSSSSSKLNKLNQYATQGTPEGDRAYELYEYFGERAAIGGLSCDLFAISNLHSSVGFGLNLLEPLARLSGGLLRKYDFNKTYDTLNHVPTSTSTSTSTSSMITNDAFNQLKEDLIKMGHRNIAYKCGLRLRTSQEINYQSNEIYGACCLDPMDAELMSQTGSVNLAGNNGCLLHLANCDTNQTICYGIDFSKGYDLISPKRQPIIQLAFSYTCIVEELIPLKTNTTTTRFNSLNLRNNEMDDDDDDDDDDGDDDDDEEDYPLNKKQNDKEKKNNESSEYGAQSEMMVNNRAYDPSEYKVKRYTGRRLRVYTLGLTTSSNVGKVLISSDLDTQLLFLAHKSCYELSTSGIIESRILVRDWLVRICLAASLHVTQTLSVDQLSQMDGYKQDDLDEERSEGSGAGLLDAEVLLGPQLSLLAPYVFGLLRGKLLGATADINDNRFDAISNNSAGGSISPSLSSLASASDLMACAEAEIYEFSPDEYRKSIYPDLIVVKRFECKNKDKGTQGRYEECFHHQSLRLSRNSIHLLENKVLLLDSSRSVCMYYPWDVLSPQSNHTNQLELHEQQEPKEEELFPFPPPPKCEVMLALEHRNKVARLTPSTVLCKAVTLL